MPLMKMTGRWEIWFCVCGPLGLATSRRNSLMHPKHKIESPDTIREFLRDAANPRGPQAQNQISQRAGIFTRGFLGMLPETFGPQLPLILHACVCYFSGKWDDGQLFLGDLNSLRRLPVFFRSPRVWAWPFPAYRARWRILIKKTYENASKNNNKNYVFFKSFFHTLSKEFPSKKTHENH